MGSAKHRSWSHTRQQSYSGCPRALYFGYYPWGDPDQNLARFLRRTVSAESLAGTIVHRHIEIGLRGLLRRDRYPLNMAKHALQEYEAALADSLRIAKVVRDGKRPPDDGVCLLHHLYGARDEAAEEIGRCLVESSLNAFEESSALEFLKDTNFDRWERILTNTDDVPSFLATSELGFSSAMGLKVYAAYDLALNWDEKFLIVDWKVGKKSVRSVDSAKRQLAVYGLWAMSQGHHIGDIMVQTYWLQEAERWDPKPLEPEHVKLAIQQIEAQDAVEREATTPVCDKHGVILKYEADREQFPTRPDSKRCGWCQYRSICAEGRALIKRQELVQVA